MITSINEYRKINETKDSMVRIYIKSFHWRTMDYSIDGELGPVNNNGEFEVTRQEMDTPYNIIDDIINLINLRTKYNIKRDDFFIDKSDENISIVADVLVDNEHKQVLPNTEKYNMWKNGEIELLLNRVGAEIEVVEKLIDKHMLGVYFGIDVSE